MEFAAANAMLLAWEIHTIKVRNHYLIPHFIFGRQAERYLMAILEICL